jgi:glycerol uptake facilitator-like aquaporin
MAEGLGRRALAEFIGTALLVIAVIGSGIAASRLSGQDASLALFENAVATGAALVAIILAVGPVSGAHLNPVISLLDRLFGGLTPRATLTYVLAQLSGGFVGAVLANLMFGLEAVKVSTHARSGSGLWLGEAIATFGLALVVFGVVRSGRTGFAAFAVGAYIAGAYFFTSSTSFANPAVTFGRMFSNTFAGIAPSSVAAFIGFQLVGGAVAWAGIRTLYPDVEKTAGRVVVPHAAREEHGGRSKEEVLDA